MDVKTAAARPMPVRDLFGTNSGHVYSVSVLFRRVVRRRSRRFRGSRIHRPHSAPFAAARIRDRLRYYYVYYYSTLPLNCCTTSRTVAATLSRRREPHTACGRTGSF